ncbi:MAG: alanine racemase [Verrucomicrobiota bacterium]
MERLDSAAWDRSWVEIDLDALRHNARVARDQAGGNCRLMAVVKADAYGHGMVPVARALRGLVEGFGVAGLAEGRTLREAGLQETVYLLGPVLPAEREEVVGRGFLPALSSKEEGEAFAALAKDGPVVAHLKVDTGMGRCGVLEEAAHETWEALARLPGLKIAGLYSHFPSADEDAAFTQKQTERFSALASWMQERSLEPLEIHLANSAGLLGFSSTTWTLLRPGLMLYGVSPLAEEQARLRPALRWWARVGLVRDVPAGHTVSYGRTFCTDRPTRTAVVTVGYGDGYPRRLSHQGAEVEIAGQRCPILGCVTMDQLVVDVTALEPGPTLGQEVVLLGEGLTARELAEKSGTIPWEIFTGITPRVRRLYRGKSELLPEAPQAG